MTQKTGKERGTGLSRMRSVLARLALVVISTVVALAASAALLWTYGVIGPEHLRLARARYLGSEELDIYRDDEVYGWTHRPHVSWRHRHPPDFDVRYRTDRHGNRVTGGNEDAPEVLVLGGSFTFGNGVDDKQAFPSLLQRDLPKHNVVNAAVAAWGTQQAWLRLDERLRQDPDPRLVIYGMITHHIHRNWLRYRWLKKLVIMGNLRNPIVAVEGERLVFRGLANADSDGLPDSSKLDTEEYDLTRRLLEDMLHRCEDRGIPFLLVFLPDGSEPYTPAEIQPTFDVFADKGLLQDLRANIDYEKVSHPSDRHLNAEGHRQTATELLPVVRRLLGDT